MVHEYFIGEFIIDNGSQVDISTLIVMISVDCEVSYSVADVWMFVGFETVDFLGIGNSSTSAEMSNIAGVLSVNVDFSVVKRIELLCPNEGVCIGCGLFFVPRNDSIILLENIVDRSIGSF